MSTILYPYGIPITLADSKGGPTKNKNKGGNGNGIGPGGGNGVGKGKGQGGGGTPSGGNGRPTLTPPYEPFAWYQPEYLEANYSDGAEVTRWDDASTNARHLTQTPLDSTPFIAEAYNGVGVFDQNTTSNRYDSGYIGDVFTGNMSTLSSGGTVVMAVFNLQVLSNLPLAQNYLLAGVTDGSGNWSLRYTDNPTAGQWAVNWGSTSGTTSITDVSWVDGNNYVVAYCPGSYFRVNGVASSTTPASPSGTFTDRFYLGTTLSANAEIGETLIFTQDLSTAEIETVEEYLIAKFGIT